MDWEKGDLALCINDTPHLPGGAQPVRRGHTYVVSEVMFAGLGLAFVNVDLHGYIACRACRFIKLNGLEADAFDREVIAALTGEPVHVPQLEREVDTCHSEVDSCFTAGRSAVQS